MKAPLALALVCLASVAHAEPKKLSLDQVIAAATGSARVQMAQGDVATAAARVDEAKGARMPRFKLTAIATISPEIHCVNPECTVTDPNNFAWKFSGLFGSATLEVTQPLYTFGKIAHARAAAEAGLAAQQALANEAAGDLAVDAARAYWGLKVARELGSMLDEGIGQLDDAVAGMDASVTLQDKSRIAVLAATAKAQRADAAAAERQALAGLRAVTGDPEADIDDEPLAAVDTPVPNAPSADGRPQAMAAKQGALANDELVKFAKSGYLPDFALVATGTYAGAQGADDPPSAFANDPYNRHGVAAVLALQWTAEPWTQHAKVERAEGEAAKAHAQSQLAAIGAQYDAEVALAEATGAKAKVDATAEGEAAGHTWLVSVLQAQAIGAAEPKDLADSYIAWFQMRAQWAQAVMQWNIAVVRLRRARGEFHAGAERR